MKILLLLLACVVTSYAQESQGSLGRVGSSAITSHTKYDVAPPASPAPGPDYASYNKNPTFKRPRILAKPDAEYTEAARLNNVRGQVLLRVLLAETGQVTRVSVVRGLPFGLTERAMAAARQIQFEPAELDGKKVAYPLMVIYNFFRPR